MAEGLTYEGLTLEGLSQLGEETPSCLIAEGVRPSGYRYKIGFITEHPTGPYIKIDSEPRGLYMARGTEQDAQNDLEACAFSLRAITGGFFEIHPFYGAVWGSKIDPIVEGFGDNAGNQDNLTMILALARDGFEFSDGLSRLSDRLGATYRISGSNASNAMAYLIGLQGANPNQGHRDIARVNGLEDKWKEVFHEYNSGRSYPTAMKPDMRSIQSTLYQLRSTFSFQIPSIPYVYYK